MTESFTAESAEEYTLSLAQIFAGSYRQILWAQQQGIPDALGLTTRQWVDERLGGYVKMQIPERKKAVQELTANGLTTRQIGDVIGVSHVTIADDVKKLTAAKTDARKQRDLMAEAKREDKTRREAAVETVPAPDIRTGKLSEALADVRDVDLVITDPPYPREFLPAWSELSEWAKAALKPGALLLAYSGQYHLPEVLEHEKVERPLRERHDARVTYETFEELLDS